jgi:hypothetical protein
MWRRHPWDISVGFGEGENTVFPREKVAKLFVRFFTIKAS